MPVFRVQMPDGRVARIQANSGDEALSFASSGMGAPPEPKASAPAPSSTYTAELARARKDLGVRRDMDEHNMWGGGAGAAILHNAPLPVLDELNAGARAGGNALANLWRGVSGDPQVSSGDIWRANMDASKEDDQLRFQAHPIASSIGGLLGGLVGSGGGVKAVAATKGAGFLPRAAATVKAAGVGGAYGGGYGFLSGNGMDDRLEKAKQGGEGGLIMGGVLEGLVNPAVGAMAKSWAPTAGRLADKFADGVSSATPDLSSIWGTATQKAAAGMKAMLTKTERGPGPIVATPSEARQAADAVFRLASKKGLTSANVDDRAAPFHGKGAMAAEVIGPEGERQLAATARRSGETGDTVRTKVLARSLGQPQRIADDFQSELGIDPEFAQGDVESMVDRGRREAGPLFDAALKDRPEGVWSPELERLSQDDMIREALTSAERSGRRRQNPAEGVTLGRVEVPHPSDAVEPPGLLDGADVRSKAPRGPSKPPSRGKSLIKFVADGGGVQDGDAMGGAGLIAADAGKWHIGRAFQPSVLGDGDLGQMAAAAHGAGYFPEFPRDRPPTGEDLVAALREELAGRPRYARPADPAAQARFDNREGHDEQLYRGHTGEEEPSEVQYGARPAPQDEPAFMEAPTAQSWDNVRQRVGKLVARDQFGKVVRTGQGGIDNSDRAVVVAQLRDELVRHLGGEGGPYSQALAKSGDYLSVQSAFERAKGRLTNGNVRDFGKLWGTAKGDGERLGIKSALANDVLELWGRGQLKGGKFAIPGVQQKLEIAFGRDGAAAFVKRMEAEARLAASGSRVAPFGGSPTMGLGEAAHEQDMAAMRPSDWHRVAHKFAHGHFLQGTADAVGTAVSRLPVHARTGGMTEGMRNEYGRLLQMSPDDLRDFMAHYETLPEAVQRRFPLPVGMGVGGMAGAVQNGTR